MLTHGGRLLLAAAEENIPAAEWLDLSTGVSPFAFPPPAIPACAWQRLPEDEDPLLAAAQSYYGTSLLLAAAGSQAVIRALPELRDRCQVGTLKPSYNEHAHAWRSSGHNVIEFTDCEELSAGAHKLDVIVVANPNNPTGYVWTAEALSQMASHLQKRQGWLVIDEAFIDTRPERSFIQRTGQPGLIVLRSLGKFFGLAGARVGFVSAWPELLQQLQELLGPWSLAGPSRYVATAALLDTRWQLEQRERLQSGSDRLKYALAVSNYEPCGSTDYFHWLATTQAQELYGQWRKQGILTRLFADPSGLRIGLASDEDAYRLLEEVLQGAIVR